jgi:peroxiredoxin
VVIINLLLTLVIIKNFNSSPKIMESGLKTGMDSPKFDVSAISGKSISNDEFKNRGLLLIFISPKCKPCQEKIFYYKSIIPIAKKSNIELIIVSLSDKNDTFTFAEKYELDTDIIVSSDDNNNSLAKIFNAKVTPSFCLINIDGKIQSNGLPDLDDNQWKSLTEQWINESRKEL